MSYLNQFQQLYNCQAKTTVTSGAKEQDLIILWHMILGKHQNTYELQDKLILYTKEQCQYNNRLTQLFSCIPFCIAHSKWGQLGLNGIKTVASVQPYIKLSIAVRCIHKNPAWLQIHIELFTKIYFIELPISFSSTSNEDGLGVNLGGLFTN